MTPRRMTEADAPWVLALIQDAFACMDGRIDPPSSMHRLSEADLTAANEVGEVWVMARAACVVLTPKPPVLYLGKLAVDPAARRKGHAATLMAVAETRARVLGLSALELQTRVELVENHETFRRLGFVEVARTAHAGFDRPTSITFRKPL